MKIGIIMGSIREGRANEAVSNWVKEVAENYTSDAQNLCRWASHDQPSDYCIKKYAARPWKILLTERPNEMQKC